MIAIAPDAPENLKKMAAKNGVSFPLIGDGKFEAMDAFGVAWGKEGKNPLPAPAVFIVDGDGLINFQYVNPTYKYRLDEAVLLAAVRALKK